MNVVLSSSLFGLCRLRPAAMTCGVVPGYSLALHAILCVLTRLDADRLLPGSGPE